jgi:hypothetical protein
MLMKYKGFPSSKLGIVLSFVLAFASALQIRMAHAGDTGWSGNGGDHLRQSDNPWNLGNEAVSYCLRQSTNTSFSKDELSAMTRSAFAKWRAFFQKSGLSAAPFRVPYGFPSAPAQFPDGVARGVSLDFKETPCSQMDHEAGIQILFDVSNPIVDDYLESHSDGSRGVALRQSYNFLSYRNGGIVWLKTFPNDPARSEHMLLHELGHVLGMPHDSTFVMDENVADFLALKNLDSSELGKIESDFWPYRFDKGTRVVLSSASSRKVLRNKTAALAETCASDQEQSNTKLPKPFRLLLGLKEVGCHILILENLVAGAGVRTSKLAFRVEAENKVVGKFEGVFEPQGHRSTWDDLSPGLFGPWKKQSPQGEGVRHFRAPLDPEPSLLPARGAFLIHGKPVAARLYLEKGLQLELFTEANAQWWVLRTK